MKPSKIILFASLAVALGSWMIGFGTWPELATVQAIGGLLGILGSVVLAWLGESPLKGK